MNPLVKIEKLLKEMKELAEQVKSEHCTYPEAIEYLKNDIHRLRGRLMQLGIKQ